MAHLLAFGGVFVCSAILAAILTMISIGGLSPHPILSFSDTQDLIGMFAFGGLSALVLGIAFNASMRTARSATGGFFQRVGVFLVPLLAITGFCLGGWAGYSMQTDYEASRAESAEVNCQQAIKSINDTEMEACKEVFLECETMVDESPCNDPGSAGQSAACSEQVKTAKAQLRRDVKLGRMGNTSSHENTLLYACIVDRVIETE